MNLRELMVRESTVEYGSADSFAGLGFANLRVAWWPMRSWPREVKHRDTNLSAQFRK
ncbi:MAG: hypothetical protein PHW60_08135 [Kiritimatiellae bacterium]|nr:hypothetical protein [Kiritimatiellia bacterium]